MISVRSRKSIVVLMFLLPLASCHKALPPPPPVAAPVPAPPPPPPTISLSADRTAITAGQSVTLTWQSSNATSVTIDSGVGSVATNGSRQVMPEASTSYTARATGPGGTASSTTVRIAVNNAPAAPARPQPDATPRPPAATPSLTLAEQFRAAMQNVLFDYDKSNIRSSEIPKLQSASTWLKRNTSVRFTIEGHADERGSQEYNVALGDERANAVKQYLASQGVEDRRMMTLSYGEERPVCHDPNEACWQVNRRAQFAMNP